MKYEIMSSDSWSTLEKNYELLRREEPTIFINTSFRSFALYKKYLNSFAYFDGHDKRYYYGYEFIYSDLYCYIESKKKTKEETMQYIKDKHQDIFEWYLFNPNLEE